MKGDTVDSEHLSEMTEEEYEVNFVKPHLKGFVKIDAKYLIPFFTRRFTQQVFIMIRDFADVAYSISFPNCKSYNKKF